MIIEKLYTPRFDDSIAGVVACGFYLPFCKRMSMSAIKGLRHYLGIQLHLWTPYESNNDTSQCSYIMPKLLKAVVIRPHKIASADSSVYGYIDTHVVLMKAVAIRPNPVACADSSKS